MYRRNRQQLVKTPDKRGFPVVSSLPDDDTLLSEDRDIDQRTKPTPLISAPAPQIISPNINVPQNISSGDIASTTETRTLSERVICRPERLNL